MKDVIILAIRYLHFIGFAALLGGMMMQLQAEKRRVNYAMLSGAFTQLATGVAAVILTFADIDHMKVTAKLVVLIAIGALLFLYRKKVLLVSMYLILVALTLANIAIAVFWR